MLATISTFVFIACAGFVFTACSSNDITNPNQIVFPASNVKYSMHVAPYLSISCNITGCHDAPSTSNMGVVLTTWAEVRDHVIPKDTLTSALVNVMYARESHDRQFISNENQRNGIKVWVKEGALDN
jgi:hypothetical protein